MGASMHSSASVAYGPPSGMTPAEMRFHHIGGYDTRTFAVAILTLVQAGHLLMTPTADGGFRLEAGNRSIPPRDATQRWLARALGVRRRPFLVGRNNYVRLLDIRRRHFQRLDKQSKRVAGPDGGTFMAGLGLSVLMLIGAVGVYARAPIGVPVSDVLMPYAWLPAVSFFGLYLWHIWRGRKVAAKDMMGVQLQGFHRYLSVAMADRLNPKFMVRGAHGMPDAAVVHAAAFGLENAWADPFVQLLEGLLPADIMGTDAADPVSGSTLPDKRGFAPRKQSRAWGIAPFIWPFVGEDADE